jgi:hypothetical protein
MTISSTSADNSLWQLLQNSQNSQTNQANSLASLLSAIGVDSSTGTGPASSATNDSSSVSNPGKLFNELEQLSKQNPAEFKRITAQIAQQLQDAAKNTTDSSEANFLNQMASNFEAASKSGNFSDLFPKNSQASGPGSQVSGHSYGAPLPSDDTLNSIFSQALSQIQKDLAGYSSSSNSS